MGQNNLSSHVREGAAGKSETLLGKGAVAKGNHLSLGERGQLLTEGQGWETGY